MSRCGEDGSRPVSGCNVVDSHCRCRETRTCPGDAAPFTFVDHEECEINLAAMLAQQQGEQINSVFFIYFYIKSQNQKFCDNFQLFTKVYTFEKVLYYF